MLRLSRKWNGCFRLLNEMTAFWCVEKRTQAVVAAVCDRRGGGGDSRGAEGGEQPSFRREWRPPLQCKASPSRPAPSFLHTNTHSKTQYRRKLIAISGKDPSRAAKASEPVRLPDACRAKSGGNVSPSIRTPATAGRRRLRSVPGGSEKTSRPTAGIESYFGKRISHG